MALRLSTAAGILVAAAFVSAPAAWADPGPPLPPLLTQSEPTPRATITATATGTLLEGTFKITAGACAPSATGSYFRMIQPGGSTSGPFVQNTDSSCGDKTYTPLSPGSDGGIVTGTY